MAGADADEALDTARDDTAETDLEALRVTREESRVVLDHQVALLNEIDDRTMRTVRVSGLLLGLVLSTVGILGPSTFTSLRSLVFLPTVLGVCSLFGCVLTGIGAYSTSNANFGIDESYRTDVLEGSYGEREWLRYLLAGYDEWTHQMQQIAERNGGYLLVAQLLLLSGFTFLVLAIVLTGMTTYL